MAKTKYENKVILTLAVSNDTEKRAAVNKISDKLTTIKTYMRTGKDANGEYNPALDFEVNVFTSGAKTPTKNELPSKPKAGDLITVEGSLTARASKSKDGKTTYKNMIIQATRIAPVEVVEDSTPADPEAHDEESAWG